jgi:hypothetical protein
MMVDSRPEVDIPRKEGGGPLREACCCVFWALYLHTSLSHCVGDSCVEYKARWTDRDGRNERVERRRDTKLAGILTDREAAVTVWWIKG